MIIERCLEMETNQGEMSKISSSPAFSMENTERNPFPCNFISIFASAPGWGELLHVSPSAWRPSRAQSGWGWDGCRADDLD